MTVTDRHNRFLAWLSGPNVAAAEIIAKIGYRGVVLDIEHGIFDLAALDGYIPLLKALGLEVHAKVLGPERGPVQQALDFGADSVVIPHIANAAHAAKICAFAKFPPRGDRSLAGGRTCAYTSPGTDWYDDQDTRIRCYPMIEDHGAVEQIAEILALDTVDGVFVGPSDLSLRRGRGAYRRTPGDFIDLADVADAARTAGKSWVLPAWAPEEQQFALDHSADRIVLTMEHSALYLGFSTAFTAAAKMEADN